MIIKNGRTIVGRTDNKQNELVAGDNITMQRDPQTGKTIISATGGGSGVSKEYVDEQDEALSVRITTNQANINTIDNDLNDLKNNVETIETEIENLDNDKADKETTYTKTEVDTKFNEKLVDDTDYTTPLDTDKLANLTNTNKQVKRITFANLWTWILTKITGICEKGIQVASGKIGHTNSITPPSSYSRFILGILDEQGHFKGTPVGYQYSEVYTSSLDNCLFTRTGANNMYVNYLKSTNGTLTKTSVITNDYSHYVKCGNIYQLSIGFQNSLDITKDTLLYTLPETISSASIEMYIVISTVAGDTRILQCGGGGSGSLGSQIKAKQVIPAGYWFGNAIFIKL